MQYGFIAISEAAVAQAAESVFRDTIPNPDGQAKTCPRIQSIAASNCTWLGEE
jgi:hypothetical protein